MFNPEGRRLTGFDMFAFVSAAVGIVADVISLSAIFLVARREQQPGLVLWIAALLSIIYTTVMVGVYSRRFFVVRGRESGREITSDGYVVIDHGASAMVNIVGIPLLVVYLLLSVVSLYGWIGPGEPPASAGMNDQQGVVFFGVLLGWVPVLVIMQMIHAVSRSIYCAFDLDYVLASPQPRRRS